MYGASVVLIWSTVATVFKLTLRVLSPVEMLMYSSFTSLIVFAILLKNPLQLLKTVGKDIRRYALFGFLNPFLYYNVLFLAYSILPAQQALPLNYTWQIFLFIFSVIFLGQRFTVRSLMAVLLGFLGVYVISTEGTFVEFSNIFGVVLALLSAVLWASFWILNLRDEKDIKEKLFLSYLFGSVYVFLEYLLLKPSLPSVEGIAGSIYIGIFEMGITYFFYLRALKLSRTTTQVSVLIYLVPFLSFAFISIFVGESIHPSSVIGALLIVFGILVETTQKSLETQQCEKYGKPYNQSEHPHELR